MSWEWISQVRNFGISLLIGMNGAGMAMTFLSSRAQISKPILIRSFRSHMMEITKYSANIAVRFQLNTSLFTKIKNKRYLVRMKKLNAEKKSSVLVLLLL